MGLVLSKSHWGVVPCIKGSFRRSVAGLDGGLLRLESRAFFLPPNGTTWILKSPAGVFHPLSAMNKGPSGKMMLCAIMHDFESTDSFPNSAHGKVTRPNQQSS